MDEREDNMIYKVVLNHEEQYSIWPADRENALGWNDAGLVANLQTVTGAQVRNVYGPTETTIWSSTYVGECGLQTMPKLLSGKGISNSCNS